MTINLFKHQQTLLDENPHKHLACWDTGVGKTLVGCLWVQKNPDLGRGLVICPKALKKNWQRNLELYKVKDVKVMTKEEFRRDWSKLEPHLKIVVDEAHYFAGMTSQMSHSLRKYIKKWNVPKVLLLTATPYMSTPWNIYILAKILGKEWNYLRFRDKFFTERYIGRRTIPVVKEGIEEEIATLVSSLGSIVRLDECADVPPQVYEVEQFELTNEQEEAMKRTVEVNPIVRFTKYHQIENGTLKGDDYEMPQFFAHDKLSRLEELRDQHDKIIIVCRYNHQIDYYREALKSGSEHEFFVIRGDVKDRDSVVQAAERSTRAVVLVQASCSEGYELPSFPVMVFASMSFSYKDYKQMVGRILRINKLKKNLYLHLVTKGVDTAVYNAIMKKQDFDIEIYAREHTDKTDEEVLGEGLPDPF